MNKSNIFLLASILVAGCATKTPNVVTYYDPYSHARTDLTSANMLQSPAPVREIVWLNASRVFTNSRDFQYYLEVDYVALAEAGYLEIPSGETLVILADGEELKFSGSGSSNSRKEHKGEVNERAIYPATARQLRSMASAQTIKVSILGRNGIVQRDFTPENFEKIRQFVQQYVTG